MHTSGSEISGRRASTGSARSGSLGVRSSRSGDRRSPRSYTRSGCALPSCSAAAATRACALAQEVGDLRSFEESKQLSAILEILRGEYDAALAHSHAALETTLRSGNLQVRADAQFLIAHVLVRMGRFAEAVPRCREALVRFASIDQLSARSEHAIALAVH